MKDVRAALCPVFAGRSVILAGPALIGGGELVRRLGELGAGPVLALTRPEAAADAAAAGAAVHAVDVGAAHSVLTQRRWDALLTDPPPEVLGTVDGFDPSREALVLVAPWCVSTSLGDRPAFGPRRAEWLAFEDKLAAEALWDSAGLPRAPAVVVDVADAPAAAAELDRGKGTVWAGDAVAGIHGGQFGVRWVPSANAAGAGAAVDATVEEMAAEHRRVRVMPFLPGRSCGIHALVLPSGVAVLRPVEHVTVRAAVEPRLRVVGGSSAWQPPPRDRAEIREAAGRVGALLAERVSYRGIVTIDGVLTAAGFRPTECNARWGPPSHISTSRCPSSH